MRYFWLIMVLIWYKINKITYFLDPIIPFHTDIGQYCSRNGYSNILNRCFSKPSFQIFCNPIQCSFGLLRHTMYDWKWQFITGSNCTSRYNSTACIKITKDMKLQNSIKIQAGVIILENHDCLTLPKNWANRHNFLRTSGHNPMKEQC